MLKIYIYVANTLQIHQHETRSADWNSPQKGQEEIWALLDLGILLQVL